MPDDLSYMRQALRLARRALGCTSPNPMVGAVLVKKGKVIGQGWHHRAGKPHAEIEALRDAQKHGQNPKGATLYVTLEPCCTHGLTPPCTDAIIAAGIKKVIVAATDPNPKHRGHGFDVLRQNGIEVKHGLEAEKAEDLNKAFNHWIVHRTPFVIVKAAMTLDGKIATASGESKWITGEKSRAYAMKLRQQVDAILVGINTVTLDDPGLTIRQGGKEISTQKRRIILDPKARTPLTAKVLHDSFAALTTIVVTEQAPKNRATALSRHATLLQAPLKDGKVDLRWLLKNLGHEKITSLLVEGGGETNALFFQEKQAQRLEFFYAPKILGGRDARKGVAGEGILSAIEKIPLRDVEWRTLDKDLLLRARIG